MLRRPRDVGLVPHARATVPAPGSLGRARFRIPETPNFGDSKAAPRDRGSQQSVHRTSVGRSRRSVLRTSVIRLCSCLAFRRSLPVDSGSVSLPVRAVSGSCASEPRCCVRASAVAHRADPRPFGHLGSRALRRSFSPTRPTLLRRSLFSCGCERSSHPRLPSHEVQSRFVCHTSHAPRAFRRHFSHSAWVSRCLPFLCLRLRPRRPSRA